MSPVNSVQITAINGITATVGVVAPAACKPSMKIRNYSGATTTYSLFSFTPSTTSTAPQSAGSLIISCAPATANAGDTCTATAASNVAAGTSMVLTAGTSANGAAPGGGGFFMSFSCQ
jgi:hypothetical protein